MRQKRSGPDNFDFRWALGSGPDPDALKRLADRCPEPRHPMGEAWFMAEKRRLYTEAQGVAPREWPFELVERLLSEATTGPVCFGPLEEWWDWYHYLLPRIVPRGSEAYLFATLTEQLVSGFIAMHPTGIVRVPNGSVTEIDSFRRDILNTLGRALMSPERWEGDNPSDSVKELLNTRAMSGYWGWDMAGGEFAASMFLCWKYLRPPEIDPWLRSVFAIRSGFFRAQLLVWLLGAKSVIDGPWTTIADFERHAWRNCWENSRSIDQYWDGSDFQPIPLIDEPNRAAFRIALKTHLTSDLVMEWIDDFGKIDYLEGALLHLPDQFIEQYFPPEP